jgi:hypothetical protein
MPRFAKLSERTGQDVTLCSLAEQQPFAALLFTWSIAAADVYGILPAHPREYHARVAPALRITEADVAAAIEAQVDAGLLHRYEAEGRQLLYLRNYHKHQTVRWARVGAPEYPLPECWRIPGKLRDHLHGRSEGEVREYGLCRGATGLCVELPDQSRTSPGVPDCGNGGELVENLGEVASGAAAENSRTGPARLDVDVDTDSTYKAEARGTLEDSELKGRVGGSAAPPAEHQTAIRRALNTLKAAGVSFEFAPSARTLARLLAEVPECAGVLQGEAERLAGKASEGVRVQMSWLMQDVRAAGEERRDERMGAVERRDRERRERVAQVGPMAERLARDGWGPKQVGDILRDMYGEEIVREAALKAAEEANASE